MGFIYQMPLIPQNTNNTCWFACFRMLASYRQRRGQLSQGDLELLNNPAYISRIEQEDNLLQPRDFATRASDFGIGVINNAPIEINGVEMTPIPDPERFGQLLKRHGPIMYCCRFVSTGTASTGNLFHAVIINGYYDSDGIKFSYLDPFPLGRGERVEERPAEEFFQEYTECNDPYFYRL